MLQIVFCTIEWGIAYVLTKIKWGFAENKNSQPKLKANQIFWGFVTWGFKLGDKLGGLIIKK